MNESQTSELNHQPHRFPNFYGCYLLQSIQKRQSFYIGSTPNPVRRLRQHNGLLTTGGAYRTKRDGTRPWEMILIVHGFPCKIAALQFEHAWQHGYKTHYILEKDRIVKSKNGGRSIHHKLSLVRLLLNHVYFRHMDLTVQFFNETTQIIWHQNKFKVEDDLSLQIKTSPGALSVPNTSCIDSIMAYANENLRLVEALYTAQVNLDAQICKSYSEILSCGEMQCGICDAIFDYTSENEVLKPYVGFCSSESCNFVGHLQCLHRYFSDEEQLLLGNLILIPREGRCPECSTMVKWTSIVRYSTILKESYCI